MGKSRVFVLAAVAAMFLLARPAAAELDAAEKTWLRTCVERLAAPGDRVRAGAEDAIVRLGTDAVVEFVLAVSVRKDPAWDVIERVCSRIGAAGSADALEKARTRWPTEQGERIQAMVKSLRASAPASAAAPAAAAAPGAGAAADADLDVAAQVHQILGSLRGVNTFDSRDTIVGKLAALGHEAVAPMLEMLGTDPNSGLGMARTAISQALPRIARPEDVPALRAALVRGQTAVAAALGELAKNGVSAAFTALLDGVRAGHLDWAVSNALRECSKDHAATGKVAHEWVTAHPGADEALFAAAAVLLGEIAYEPAVPDLEKILRATRDSQLFDRASVALTQLGSKTGIEGLVLMIEKRTFTGPTDRGSSDVWHVKRVVDRLNEIAGQTFVTVDSMKLHPNGNGDAEAMKDVADAAPAIRAWWDSVKEKARWDKATQRWLFQ